MAATVYVCALCGLVSPDKEGKGALPDSGWDSSCTAHAVLCLKDTLVIQGGRVARACRVPRSFDEASLLYIFGFSELERELGFLMMQEFALEQEPANQ